jgi:hypothetical protein
MIASIQRAAPSRIATIINDGMSSDEIKRLFGRLCAQPGEMKTSTQGRANSSLVDVHRCTQANRQHPFIDGRES